MIEQSQTMEKYTKNQNFKDMSLMDVYDICNYVVKYRINPHNYSNFEHLFKMCYNVCEAIKSGNDVYMNTNLQILFGFVEKEGQTVVSTLLKNYGKFRNRLTWTFRYRINTYNRLKDGEKDQSTGKTKKDHIKFIRKHFKGRSVHFKELPEEFRNHVNEILSVPKHSERVTKILNNEYSYMNYFNDFDIMDWFDYAISYNHCSETFNIKTGMLSNIYCEFSAKVKSEQNFYNINDTIEAFKEVLTSHEEDTKKCIKRYEQTIKKWKDLKPSEQDEYLEIMNSGFGSKVIKHFCNNFIDRYEKSILYDYGKRRKCFEIMENKELVEHVKTVLNKLNK